MCLKYRNTFILDDCLNVLPEIPDECVDLVLTDPPYNISNEVVISRGSQGKYKGQDITSDFGKWDHFETDEEYIRFTQRWLGECARILRPGGILITFFDKRRLSWVFDMLNNFKVKDVITWVKRNPVPQVRKVKFAQATEMAAAVQKPDGPLTFNWQLGYHPNYIKLPICAGHERLKDKAGKTLHMTQKPERLFRWLVDYYTNKGDLVLDPFAGTGTLASVCIQTERNYICIEREEKYFLAAEKRLGMIQIDLLGIDYKGSGYKIKYR